MIGKIVKVIKRLMRADIFCLRCNVKKRGRLSISKDIIGKGNILSIGEKSILNKVKIRIRGNNNKIYIGNHCYIGKGSSIWAEGNNITIIINDYSTFTHDDQICAQEDNVVVTIGSDCMFSHHITVRTSDSHLIFDVKTNERQNPANSVTIGDHVWIAPNSYIMKGVSIGNGTIIGTNTIVTKNIPAEVLAVGMPAKVVKTNVSWSRERLF